jgi:hypothetical protein
MVKAIDGILTNGGGHARIAFYSIEKNEGGDGGHCNRFSGSVVFCGVLPSRPFFGATPHLSPLPLSRVQRGRFLDQA